MKKLHMVITGLILAGLCLLTQLDYEDELLEQARYCSMVVDYVKSNGESGHPDYNGNYTEVCK
jgi:hypothetical protein